MALWLVGFPERALVQEVEHPVSLMLAQVWLAWPHQFRQEAQSAHDQAADATARATQQGFSALYMAWGTVLQGWVLMRQEQRMAGMAKMREGVEVAVATGPELFLPYVLVLLAEAAGAAGQPEDGLRLLADQRHCRT